MGFSEKISELEKVIVESMPLAKEVALNTLLGAFSTRIFQHGKATDNSKIGEYSTKPMLIGGKGWRTAGAAAAFFKEKQEWRKVNTKKGKQSLALIEGGYKEFRQLNSLQTDHVDLEFKSDLKFSIIVGDFNGEKVLGFNSEIQHLKSQGLEKHFKKVIFEPTQEEIEIAQEAYLDYIREQVQETFNSW